VKTGFSILLLLMMTACSSNKVIIDKNGVDMVQYQRDMEACQAYAREVESGEKVAGGAIGGALLGAAIGALVGDSKTAAKAAGVGGVTGATRGAGSAANEKNRVVKNCLRGRGYKVLN